jgi:hypothetical protein
MRAVRLGHRHLGLHRIRNEADFMRFMVHVVQLRLVRNVACPFDPRMKNNLCDGLLARCHFLHHALGMVAIGSDDEARQSGHMQERKHVAVREGGDQHFLWVNGFFHGPLADGGDADAGTTVPPSKSTCDLGCRGL